MRLTRVDSAALVGLAPLMAVYVLCCLSPSSYAVALNHLGVNAVPMLGEARGIRSDEWGVMTPFFQIAVLGHHVGRDTISPYHETLKGFLALPITDWSLIFKPQLWMFWITPPEYAFSFYFAFLYAAFLIGYTILFRQLGARNVDSIFLATAFLFSQFVQVWWGSNAPTFAFAPWPAVAFLSTLRPALKFAAVFYASAFWIFGLVYPPFIISAAFAIGIAILMARKDALKRTDIIVSALAVAAAGACVYLYFRNLLPIMEATTYPGHRDETGGGVPIWKFVMNLFPAFGTDNFVPMRNTSNECEVAVASTYVPLLLLFFGEPADIGEFVKEHRYLHKVFAIGILAMAAWMLLPIPSWLGKPLLWNQVPPKRMMWGFGLLTICYAAVAISHIRMRLTWRRVVLFAIITLLVRFFSRYGFTRLWGTPETASLAKFHEWFDLAAVAFMVVLFLALKWLPKTAAPLLTAAALSGLVTFGTFNPVQSTKTIFHVPDSPFLDSARANAKANPNGWAVMGGWYAAELTGAGISAINHVLPLPQLQFFRRVFPAMPSGKFDRAFNRYEHIIPDPKVTVPTGDRGDTVRVPVAIFEKKL